MDLRGKRIEEGYTNLVTVEGDSVASSGKLQNGQGTDLGNVAVGGLSFNSGDSELQLPAGTTAERPASPSAGYARFNTDKGKVEIYTGAAWLSIALEGAVQLEAATATVTGQDAVAQLTGFIEQFGTPASAFSVRKLGDTDVCMRVRRSSDNAEQNIGFDGIDLDETALTTFVGANDGFVTTWYDQSVDNSTLPAEHGSGATASYSLRLVDSTYTGDAIRVRRSSDNTEQDIGFVDGELDTSTLETFCSGTNGFVTTWYDQSGSNDATQATAGSQPQIVSSGTTITENGKPAIDFERVTDTDGDFLRNLDIVPNPSLFVSQVYKADSQSFTTDDGCIISLGKSTFDVRVDYNDGNELRMTIDQIATAVPFTQTEALKQNIVSLTGDGSNYKTFLLGEQRISDTVSASFTGYASLCIGARDRQSSIDDQYDGTIQELIYYDTDQSSNRESIELNQASYYDIGVSIGATQSTAGSQPKIVSSGSVIKENSVPALDFDGSDDNLVQDASYVGTNDLTFISAQTIASTSSRQEIAYFGDDGASDNFLIMRYSDTDSKYAMVGQEGASGSATALSSTTTDTNGVMFATRVGTTGTVSFNGSTGSPVTNAELGANVQESLYIASNRNGNYTNNLHQEIIIYVSDKSSDQSNIESNIATYFNITI